MDRQRAPDRGDHAARLGALGVPLLVTRAEGIDIIELDGRPAATVYEEQLGPRPAS